MTRDVIERPDWNVAATSTIAGGYGGDGDDPSGFWNTLPAATADAVSGLPAGVVSEWAKSGGVAHRLAVAQSAAGTILGQLADTVDLLADFDVLPAAAQAAAFSELSLGSTAIAVAATSAEVKAFGDSEEGVVLVQEWRNHAPRRLGILKSRIKRILIPLSATDREAVQSWWDALDSYQSYVILKQLAR